MTFKEEMITKFIPSIERMIEEEKEHIKFLEKLNYKESNHQNFLIIQEMLQKSENTLIHLEKRHQEYTDYISLI